MPGKLDVDWDEIRAEWERTDVSDAALAERWGFKSANSIQRKRKADGWTRDREAVAAVRITQAARTHTPHTHSGPEEDQPLSSDTAIPVCGKGPDLPPDPSAQTPLTRRDPEGDGRRLDLMSIQVQATRQALTVSDGMIEAGAAWVHLLHILATSDDETELINARHRMHWINPDKETLKDMMKAAPSMVEMGVKIKRQALGMDTAKAPEPEPVTQSEVSGPAVAALLSVEALLEVRRVARELQRNPTLVTASRTIDQEK